MCNCENSQNKPDEWSPRTLCGVGGLYKRVYGDTNQSSYLRNVRGKDKINYIYYNKNKEVINEGEAWPLNKTRTRCKAVHTLYDSKSICNKLYVSNDYTLSVCKGYCKKKFNKRDIGYTSQHKYYKVENVWWYENIYFFSDGTISSAVYKKID